MKKESAVDSIIDNFGNLTKVIETVILLSEHLEDTTQNYNDIVQVLNSVPNKDIVYKLENRTHGVVKLISEAIVKKCNTFQAFVYNLQLYLQKETL